MAVELTEITADNLGDVYDLAVGPGQSEFVASNPRSLAQAYAERDIAWPLTMRIRPALIVVTAAVADWAAESDRRAGWLAHCLSRHVAGDWGDLDVDHRRANDYAVRTRDGRLLSRYDVPTWLEGGTDETALWIITDDLADPDTATTLLWPSDY